MLVQHVKTKKLQFKIFKRVESVDLMTKKRENKPQESIGHAFKINLLKRSQTPGNIARKHFKSKRSKSNHWETTKTPKSILTNFSPMHKPASSKKSVKFPFSIDNSPRKVFNFQNFTSRNPVRKQTKSTNCSTPHSQRPKCDLISYF